MSHTTPVYGITTPDSSTKVRELGEKLSQMGDDIEAALQRAGIAPIAFKTGTRAQRIAAAPVAGLIWVETDQGGSRWIGSGSAGWVQLDDGSMYAPACRLRDPKLAGASGSWRVVPGWATVDATPHFVFDANDSTIIRIAPGAGGLYQITGSVFLSGSVDPVAFSVTLNGTNPDMDGAVYDIRHNVELNGRTGLVRLRAGDVLRMFVYGNSTIRGGRFGTGLDIVRVGS